MDIPSSISNPSCSISPSSDASNLLANLPSRGLFSSTTISSNLGGIRHYICDHDTEPPEEQLITTNKTNILVASLTSKKSKGDSKSPSRENRKKRTPESTLEGRSKRAGTSLSSQSSSRHDALKSGASGQEYRTMTVERLRVLLKERGLSVRGKKVELISRLREADK